MELQNPSAAVTEKYENITANRNMISQCNDIVLLLIVQPPYELDKTECLQNVDNFLEMNGFKKSDP